MDRHKRVKKQDEMGPTAEEDSQFPSKKRKNTKTKGARSGQSTSTEYIGIAQLDWVQPKTSMAELPDKKIKRGPHPCIRRGQQTQKKASTENNTR